MGSKSLNTKVRSKGNSGESDQLVDCVAEPKYAQGTERPFLISTVDKEVAAKRHLGRSEYLMLLVLAVVALGVRCYHIGFPNSVVFDEVHFGGFARKYILREFFMDVHPPLVKMLFAAVASYFGFKGDFEFKDIGDVYPETTPYYYMRLLSALMGVGTVLLCYLTLCKSGCKPIIAFVTSFALIVENANVTISRYILLDSPLIFFIAATVYTWTSFQLEQPFTMSWYKSLFSTGVFLGFALSSKWIGLFTVAWVGISCILQLWFIIGDLTVKPRHVLIHVLSRGFIILGTALTLYLMFFKFHFDVLTNDGEGAPFMSSSFRASLADNTIPKDIAANVGFGSIVSIRHLDTDGGYLHSHNHYYPEGSQQQQITLYPHLDTNNLWLIEPYNESMPETFVPICDGTKIRLKHINSGKRLHSHDEKPPVSERDWEKEASCYGYEGFEGDANDDFIVEVVKQRTPESAVNEIKALKTVFRLRHAMTGNYLFSGANKLPDWGFDQSEVTCANQGKRYLTHWYIEANENEFLNDTQKEIVNYEIPGFWKKLGEAHVRMWKINQGLTDFHNWQSSPEEWPALSRGINYWVKDHKQVYLIGNALIWWSTTFTIGAFILHTLASFVRWSSGSKIATNKLVFNFNMRVFEYTVGWGLHYLPFFIMGRQLFLHHYLPAYYFGILVLGHFLDMFVSYVMDINSSTRLIAYFVVASFLVNCVLIFFNYSSLIYALPWIKSKCNEAKIFSTWDFDCPAFLDNYSDYLALNATST